MQASQLPAQPVRSPASPPKALPRSQKSRMSPPATSQMSSHLYSTGSMGNRQRSLPSPSVAVSLRAHTSSSKGSSSEPGHTKLEGALTTKRSSKPVPPDSGMRSRRRAEALWNALANTPDSHTPSAAQDSASHPDNIRMLHPPVAGSSSLLQAAAAAAQRSKDSCSSQADSKLGACCKTAPAGVPEASEQSTEPYAPEGNGSQTSWLQHQHDAPTSTSDLDQLPSAVPITAPVPAAQAVRFAEQPPKCKASTEAVSAAQLINMGPRLDQAGRRTTGSCLTAVVPDYGSISTAAASQAHNMSQQSESDSTLPLDSSSADAAHQSQDADQATKMPRQLISTASSVLAAIEHEAAENYKMNDSLSSATGLAGPQHQAAAKAATLHKPVASTIAARASYSTPSSLIYQLVVGRGSTGKAASVSDVEGFQPAALQTSTLCKTPAGASMPARRCFTKAPAFSGASLLEGSFDESAGAASFQEAVVAWRSGHDASCAESPADASRASGRQTELQHLQAFTVQDQHDPAAQQSGRSQSSLKAVEHGCQQMATQSASSGDRRLEGDLKKSQTVQLCCQNDDDVQHSRLHRGSFSKLGAPRSHSETGEPSAEPPDLPAQMHSPY